MPDAKRDTDHAAIGDLAERLLPALIAKLSTTRLGELEVREGEWKVRLRRPAGSEVRDGRRATDRPSRTQPGHEGHAHPRGALEAARGARGGPGQVHPDGTPSTNGSGGTKPVHAAAALPDDDPAATSPAVGVFHPGTRAAAGTRIRAGDSLGSVDVLGVPQEIISPVDGIVGATLVEAGTAVEYGQQLVQIELASPAEAR